MIAVERRDDPQIGRNRLHLAQLDSGLGEPQRLHEPRDLHPGEALGRVEPPLGERPVDFAAHRGGAGLHHFCDLAQGIARHHQIEAAFPPLEPVFAPRPHFGSSPGGLGHGRWVVVHFCFSVAWGKNGDYGMISV